MGRCRFAACALALLVSCGAAQAHAQGRPAVTLQQHTYQTVRTPPFNGQLAFYAGDIPSTARAVTLPIVVHVLIGNGQRPFAVDTGAMTPQDFTRYVARLKTTGAVRVIPFRIQKEGDRMTFVFLRRRFAITAADLIPCRGCPGRVQLTVEQADR